jgi:hypothetical protein
MITSSIFLHDDINYRVAMTKSSYKILNTKLFVRILQWTKIIKTSIMLVFKKTRSNGGKRANI